MIKNKTKPISLLLASMLFGTMSFAQSIYFKYTDGTSAMYNLEDIRKITFNADVMNLQLRDGSLYEWNVSTIGYYRHNETTVNNQEWLNVTNTWQVKVFPNPAQTELNIVYNLLQAEDISIALCDIQGKQIASTRSGDKTAGKHEVRLDLSNVASGTYLCRIVGQHTIITKQIIKQ